MHGRIRSSHRSNDLFCRDPTFGVACDIMLGFSIVSGVLGGPEKGALAGFVFGIMFDLVLGDSVWACRRWPTAWSRSSPAW